MVLVLIDITRVFRLLNFLVDLLPTYGTLPHDGVVLQQLGAHQRQQNIEHAELEQCIGEHFNDIPYFKPGGDCENGDSEEESW